MAYRIAVFDFDGTLVDSREAIVTAANGALRAAGLAPRPATEIRPLIGRPLEQVLGPLAGAAPHDPIVGRLCEEYRRIFDEVFEGRTRTFDGVEEAIGRLRAAGIGLAIASNRGRPSLEAMLYAHDLRDAFSFVLSGFCVSEGKPNPEMLHRILDHFGAAPQSAVMIGDTVIDIRVGRAAGVATCAVTYGHHDEAELQAEGPTHLVHHPGELLPLFGVR